jgi:hypothetical protein
MTSTRCEWGEAFLNAADAFVAKWAASEGRNYAEAQKKEIDWATRLSETVLKAV